MWWFLNAAPRLYQSLVASGRCTALLWAWSRFLEIPFGNLRVWEGVEIMEILEIWGSGEVWKVEILEVWPQNARFPLEWKFDPKPAETWTRAKV